MWAQGIVKDIVGEFIGIVFPNDYPKNDKYTKYLILFLFKKKIIFYTIIFIIFIK